MKLFKRIFTFAIMAILGVVTLTSCVIAGGNSIQIDMEARVYVSQSYDLVAKDGNGQILSDVKWMITEGQDFVTIKDGKLVASKAGVFTLQANHANGAVAKKFSAINVAYWDIDYNLNGGEDSEELFKTYTEFEEGKELAAPTRFGYEFAGWYENAEFEGEPVTKVNGVTDGRNIELFAKWELVVYPIEFELNAGSCEGLAESYSVENPLSSLPEASKEHYTFVGWFTEEGEKVEALGVDIIGVTKLVAQYEAVSYELSYELNGGEVEGNPETYTVEDQIALVAPTKHGYKFLGWELNGELVEEIALGTSGNLELAAKWEVVEYELSFELNDGAAEGLPSSYSIEAPIEALPEAAKEHYIFLGWYDGETKVEKLDADNLGITQLVAKYEAVKYEISYELNGGKVESNPETYTVEEEVALTAPEKLGYKFLGWELNGELVQAIAKGTSGALELAAKWELVVFELSFELNGGASEGLPSSYSIEAPIEALPEAAKEHYIFLGWYDGETKVEKLDAENLGIAQLVAKYEAVKYEISYELNGGKEEGNPKFYTVEEEVSLGVASKAGYEFLGWQLDGEVIETIPAGTSGNLEFSALWILVVYEISFDLNGGTAEDLPTKYSVKAPVESLPEATKENYIFLGWYDGETKVEALNEETAGVTQLVAKYEAVKFNISYNLDGGENAAENPATYTVEDEILLAVPTKSGYKFLGWELNGELVESIAKGSTGDIELVATWKSVGILVDGVYYATLAEAVAAAKNGTVIKLIAGEYELSKVTISANITIEGPNAGVHGNGERVEEAIIKMDSILISAAVTIDGVKLVGSGYMGNTALFGGAKLSQLVLKNSVVENYKNVFYTEENHDANIPAVVLYENNKFADIGQFFFWIASDAEGQGYESFNFINNYTVAGDKYAGITAVNGMFSIRHTNNDKFEMNIIGNYLVNPTDNSYFRLNTGNGTVKYNTFVGVNLFQSNNNTAPINYDENLYLDAAGNVLEAAPSAVANKGGVADTTVLATEEERLEKFEDWYYPYDTLIVDPSNPDAYQSFEDAYKAAEAGDHIVLVAGKYTISGITIDKDIVLVGPNAGVHGNAERAEEAEISMSSVLVSAAFTIDGVKLVGSGYMGNTALFGGAKLSELVLRNSVVENYKNVFYTEENHDASVAAVVIFENNKFADLGQFFFWIASDAEGQGYKSFNFLNNYTVAGSKYAGISAVNGMFSIRHTNNDEFVMNIIGNYLVNPTDNSYFRLNTGKGVVKHNTFVGVNLFQSNNNTAPINYDENLYLDAAGNVLEAAPSAVANKGGVADTTVLATEEERAQKAQAWFDSFYSAAEYKIEYELNGGLLPEGSLDSFIASDLPYVLPTPNLEGKVFLGWYENPEFTGSKITSIAFGTENDVKLYARFGEEWELKAIYVGANQEYQTIADALAAAKEGAYIVVDAGTYEEDIVVNKSVSIYGANYGVAYNAERKEETIINSITIEGDNITVDGIKSNAIQAIEIKAGNNITIANSIFGGTPTAINQQMILVSGEVNGFYLYDSLFSGKNEGLAYTHYRAILANGKITNAEIRGNKFEQFAATSVYIDGVKLTRIAGSIVIEENTFNWPGDNWTVYLGSSLVAYNTIVNFNYNVFDGEVAQSGASVVNCDETTTVNMIGNIINNVKGNVLQVRGTGSGDRTTLVCANISHNQFNGTSTKVSISASEKYVVVDSNYFFQDVVWSHNNKCVATNNAATPEEALTGITQYKVSYELNGGTTVADLPEYYYANQIANLTYATPSKEAYTFLGWYDNAEFTGDPITHLGSQAADIVLYAKFELIPVYSIKYELDGGAAEGLIESAFVNTEIKLPTPEKFGFVFLGWSLEQGSTEYVKSIKLEQDTILYANWVQAEIYKVTFNLNGGSVRYASRYDMLMDFLADYNEYSGKSYTDPSQMPTGSWDNIDFHTFFEATLADGTVVRDKWLWLAEYLYELSVRDLASNNCNVLGLRDLINKGTISGDDPYGISYAFRAFIAGSIVRPGSSYTSVDYTVYTNANGFWDKLSAAEPTEVDYYGTVTLPQAGKGVYKFAGWYDNPEFTGDAITEIDGACTLYAKFIEPAPVESVTIDNKVTEMKRYETLQLTWTLNPAEPTISNVRFSSSDESVATVDDKGLVTAVANGKVTITVVSDSETKATDQFEMEVYSPDHFEIAYVTTSYAPAGQTIQLSCEYIKRDGTKEAITWSSLTPEIATVDSEGVVTAVAEGAAVIRAALTSNAEVYQDFPVTVLAGELSNAQQFVLESHESNVFTRYDLGIGSGTPAYYEDIFGSISKMLYNHALEISTEYLAKGDASGRYYDMQSLEFITVHYTGNMSKGADAAANAAYFVGDNSTVSIHYTTGNDGIYSNLSHQYGAWHAGDSGSVDRVGHFEWIPTGVKYDNCDLLEVVFTASDDFYFEINGQKTTIKLPETYNHKERNTDHIYNADGTISAQPDYDNWGTTFENRDPESFFNDQDFGIKVVDGEYYMGKTWWSYGQVYEGRICSNGGNYNSIGIESCVDVGSDLWLTWQYTAQLVAYLLDTYDLGLERVKGHHFFDGKDCPQPMLENDLEIWWELIDLIAAELKLRQEFEGYEFAMQVGSDYTSFVSENGRILDQPEYAQVIEYTVTITNGDSVETITLASAVNGIYSK